jgi:hypothetical protein
MTTKDDDPKEPKGGAERAAGSKKGEKKKPKEGEKRPYAGTHGYTEEELNEIIRDRKRKK